ncbi:hypothetical protein DAPPUDRAFT_262678 [Daphnia pulex]|uniref:Uncharacterized protein n=1 Tax=Daphnia pulex TaxID=6669 RepID=E9HNG6_DAPPU|nr:hypothetical protein DAPPUDRAFT_262678 [Daphnia pulex]|eukprot:EFX66715.1 hypothetical protein DAPPUDRAFT_262678 [Daphnia pulex]
MLFIVPSKEALESNVLFKLRSFGHKWHIESLIFLIRSIQYRGVFDADIYMSLTILRSLCLFSRNKEIGFRNKEIRFTQMEIIIDHITTYSDS